MTISKIKLFTKCTKLMRLYYIHLTSNNDCFNFYLKHGAERYDGESHFKFAGDAFARLAL